MSALPARASLRRGWCPSALRPMETGDGWLVRLRWPRAEATPAQIVRIAELAREHGNGLIEISARGNMQVRGVRPRTHPALVAALLAEALVDEHDGDGPQRPTLTAPLAGLHTSSSLSPHPEEPRSGVSKDDPALSGASWTILRDAIPVGMAPQDEGSGGHRPNSQDEGCGVVDPIDAAALAARIDAACHAIPGLPAKLLVVVDGGGPMALDAFAADIRLVGVAPDRVAIGLPGNDWRGPLGVEAALAETIAILQRFAALRWRSPDIRRLRDLDPARAALCALASAPPPLPRPAPRRVGLFALAVNSAAIAGLAFGRCDAETLRSLGEAALRLGASALRLSPWRGIAATGLDETAARDWLDHAAALGLVTRDDDPRLSVQACAGRPACARAQTDAMADAALLAEAAAPLLSGGATLHVSGCVKSCAHPGKAALTLVGRAGRYDVVLGGGTRDAAAVNLDLAGMLAGLRPAGALHAALSAAAPTEPRP